MPAERPDRPRPARSAKSLKRQEKRDRRERTARLFASRRLSPAGRWAVTAGLAGIVPAVLLAVTTSRTQITWAGSWVGGPTGFTVTVGVLTGLALPLVSFALMVGEQPQRVSPRFRFGAPVRATIIGLGSVSAVVGTVLLLFAQVPGSPRASATCTDLGCWLAVHAPWAARTGAITAGVTLLLGAIGVALLLSDDDPRERRRNGAYTAVIGVVVAVLITALVLSTVFSAELHSLAQRWPGGAPFFLFCIGACVPGGWAAAALVWRTRRVLPRPLAGLLASLPLAAGLAAGVFLVTTARPRGYEGPILCDDGFYCLLDQNHGNAGLTVGLGWLGVLVTGVLLGYAAVRARKRSR